MTEPITHLITAVDYQKDAIVSQTLLKKNSGTITLFAFDKGQDLSEHTAPFDALVQVLEGKAVVTISGEDHRVAAGEMIILPANKPHAVRAEEKFKMLLIMIRS
ncbi:MAG: cupin domain-containing protein [FCB group bacterium]|nr:cupin domain-containing protein [FCB group bacterium]